MTKAPIRAIPIFKSTIYVLAPVLTTEYSYYRKILVESYVSHLVRQTDALILIGFFKNNKQIRWIYISRQSGHV